MIGQIEEREQNWQKAYGAYAQAVELDPANGEARVKKGTLLLAR